MDVTLGKVLPPGFADQAGRLAEQLRSAAPGVTGVDAPGGRLLGLIPPGTGPSGTALSPDGARLYVASTAAMP